VAVPHRMTIRISNNVNRSWNRKRSRFRDSFVVKIIVILLIARSVSIICRAISGHFGTIVRNKVLGLQNLNQPCERFISLLKDHTGQSVGHVINLAEHDRPQQKVIPIERLFKSQLKPGQRDSWTSTLVPELTTISDQDFT
jgi:hypothetical protein